MASSILPPSGQPDGGTQIHPPTPSKPVNTETASPQSQVPSGQSSKRKTKNDTETWIAGAVEVFLETWYDRKNKIELQEIQNCIEKGRSDRTLHSSISGPVDNMLSELGLPVPVLRRCYTEELAKVDCTKKDGAHQANAKPRANWMRDLIASAFARACEESLSMLKGNTTPLRTLSIVERAALFSLGSTCGGGEDVGQRAACVLTNDTAWSQHFEEGFIGLVKHVGSKPLANRHLSTLCDPIMKLMFHLYELDQAEMRRNSDKNTGNVLVKGDYTEAMILCCRLLLHCLKNRHKKRGWYLKSGESAHRNPTIQAVFKLVTASFESLSSSDPYDSLDNFETFCSIMERRMVVITEYLVTFHAKLLAKKSAYADLFHNWGYDRDKKELVYLGMEEPVDNLKDDKVKANEEGKNWGDGGRYCQETAAETAAVGQSPGVFPKADMPPSKTLPQPAPALPRQDFDYM